MKYYIGIDLGTSAVKLLLVDGIGEIHRSVSKEYPIFYPHPGWSEQNPEDWWEAVKKGLFELLAGIPAEEIGGIGTGGQMHGLVVLDKEDRVIRPAILWNDGRTEDEVTYLNEVIGKSTLTEETANIAFAGFTAPKLLWMKKNEPELFGRIEKIMLPKDYINYKLTGVHATDLSDASGMLLLDVKNRTWSEKMLALTGVTKEQLPKLFESYEVIGNANCEIPEITGVPVVAGAGDNAAAAVGTGTVENGSVNISLGTSGTVFIASDRFAVDENNALHAFCHSNGRYHLMGCMLSAASCNKWLCEDVLNTKDYRAEQAEITDDMLGRNHVFFLPYLMGERSPINDTNARGTFTGLTMDTTRKELVLSVLEGVAFALRDCFEVAKKLGIEITGSKVCGGGAKSELWLKIIANVLNIELRIPKTQEGPGFGGAMLAMVGTKAYESVEACANALVTTEKVITTDPEIAERYEKMYARFSRIYPALKDTFKEII